MFLSLWMAATTTIGNLVDTAIANLQTKKTQIDAQIADLQIIKDEYGTEQSIEQFQQYKTEDGTKLVIITSLDRFPQIGFRYLQLPGAAKAALMYAPPEFMDLEDFKEQFTVFVEYIKQI